MAAVTRTRALALGATAALAGITAATALAVPPPPDATLKGQTNQPKSKYHKVTLVTDANAHVSKISVGWRAPCSEKDQFWSTETEIDGGSAGLPQKGDVFHQEGSYTGHAGGGVTGKVTLSMKGHFTDTRHAKGTWNAKVTVKKAGKTIDKCKVSNIKWKAKRTA